MSSAILVSSGVIKDPRAASTARGVTDCKGVDMTYLRPFIPSSIYSHKENYLRYLDSREWQARKRAYWESNRPKYCWACGLAWDLNARGFNFHHVTYANLYNEKLEDLVLLCTDHHKEIESEWPDARKSGMTLELWTYVFICNYRVEKGLPIKLLMKFFRGLID
jgi:hypothetical protein